VKSLLAAALVLVICQGCATTPSRQAATLKEATARDVTRCALISTIVGKSLMGGAVATSANNAIVDAKEQAAGLGANAVVLEKVDSGGAYAPATATLKAYRCN
jgi:hypothetical protein